MRTVFNKRLQMLTTLHAIRMLFRQLGFITTLTTLSAMVIQQLRGEPFGKLDTPTNTREKLSREQIAPAILLYRAVRPKLGDEEAKRITRDVVIDATQLFLSRVMGNLPEALALPAPHREQWVRERGEQFFNAAITWTKISDNGVDFTVTACAFPRLCRSAGVPELAPIFCEGDLHYFNSPYTGLSLVRTQTIAEGATHCPFSIAKATNPEKTSS